MRLSDYLRIARRRWPILAAGLLIGVVAAAGSSRATAPTYTASSTVYISMATGTSVNDSYQGGLAAQQRVRSYLELARSRTVAERTHDELGLRESVDAVRSRISAVSPPASTLMVISARDGTPDGARRLTDAVVAQFRRLVDELETIERGQAPAARVTVVDDAQTPTAAGGPLRLMAMGASAGLMLGYLAAFLRDRLDRRMRTDREVAEALPVPVLATVRADDAACAGELRKARNQLLHNNSRVETVLVTGLTPEPPPTVAVGIARSFSDLGAAVVLVDADPSGHGVSALVQRKTTPGLVEVMTGDSTVADAVTTWPEAGVWVLTIGAPGPGTADLLVSERFCETVAELREQFDHVVIVAASSGAAELPILAARCDQVLATVNLARADRIAVSAALAALDREPAGAVVIRAPETRARRLCEQLRQRLPRRARR
ncbi:protein tyrosine kinase [Nocardia sp. NPDC088792]|uniref:protein tyrosine kinase n=1 Tax=Nocardia sp. NPDC088792 TaxID=3364332 RepID=UPI003820DCD1